MAHHRASFAGFAAILPATLLVAHCSDDSTPPTVDVDAAAFDASHPDVSSVDAAVADGALSKDAAIDSALDAGADSADAEGDSASDAAFDAGVDAGPGFDEAGCPLPTGIALDATDAGLPSGPVVWLRGDLGVATFDGGVVCRWDDLSGNNRAFLPGGTGTPPAVNATALSSKAAVAFSGATYVARGDLVGIPATSGRTFVAYGASQDTTHRFHYVFQGQGASAGTYFGLDMNTFNTSGSKEGVYVTNNAYDANLATSTNPRKHIYSIDSFVADTALPGALVYAVDGNVLTLSRTSGGLGNNKVESFASANFTTIGGGVAGFTGALVGEVLIYDRALTALERTAVNQYLAARFP